MVSRRGSRSQECSLVLRLVALHVQRQVIAAREAPLADHALERLRAGMLAIVTRQFVGTREAPLTVLPLARVRFFTCGGDETKGRKEQTKCIKRLCLRPEQIPQTNNYTITLGSLF